MCFKFVLYITWLCHVLCSLSNVSSIHREYPAIKEGDPCIKGKMYKMSCNTCHCADNNALYCTKMACLEHEDIERFSLIKKRSPQRNLRGGTEEIITKDKYLPNLPEGRCLPGKLYRKGCQKCYCDNTGKTLCNPLKACKELPKITDVSTPNDVTPQLSNEEFWQLPVLPHSAAKCQSGKMYLVDCNTCLCLDNGNLLCEKLLCLNQDEENAAKAKKWSGNSGVSNIYCTNGSARPVKYHVLTEDLTRVQCNNADDTLSNRCVRCNCTKNKTQCRPVLGCAMPTMLKLHGNNKMRLNLDIGKDKCKPGAVYKTDCNRCYCQSDLSLRCTQKSCLNYRQALKLKRQRSYLEKYGL